MQIEGLLYHPVDTEPKLIENNKSIVSNGIYKNFNCVYKKMFIVESFHSEKDAKITNFREMVCKLRG